MEELIEWLLWHERVNKEMLSSDEEKSDFEIYLEDENRKISLIKEYLTDYEKLAKDYRDVELKNKLLKIEKMELEGRYIYEDMRMKYRANRRKWGARYV
ncbi:hypothetical protein [Streptococcus pseudopneumoniae]|jgi:hypothetical protein|uniref:hypothetical protein n=1 Tax=Streptococcus pseudopneumoniae TaxID=257758 RepID=UPI0003D309AA|nr:hypothetical protein [Streptococcus pseudopneumoniae]ETE04485.1 hypothetical protein U751_08850 [Streptococcus pseudopneumoniae 22725]TMR50113.1 hypothetical protein E3V25_10865 [Streptococcus pseudopneumoniae]TMR65372.1 hypothetical protein E3V82_06240 [Streptococcus pseudopneumoniae]TMR74745.1 hypothetical protein E3V91_00865 [Streptococcus pseudopneumoniae]